jgi:hypothetical protein
MPKKHLLSIMIAVVLVVLAVSSFSVYAQDTDDHTPPFGMMGHHGGMMGGMRGMMWHDDDHTMLAGAAELLEMTVDELYDALHSGTSLQDLAKEKDVNLDNLTNAMLEGMKTHMAEAVEAGYITQDQADEHLAWMSENLTEMPMFNGTAGGMMGMMGQMHGGMGRGMGRGH